MAGSNAAKEDTDGNKNSTAVKGAIVTVWCLMSLPPACVTSSHPELVVKQLALGVGRAVAVGELEPGLLQPLA